MIDIQKLASFQDQFMSLTDGILDENVRDDLILGEQRFYPYNVQHEETSRTNKTVLVEKRLFEYDWKIKVLGRSRFLTLVNEGLVTGEEHIRQKAIMLDTDDSADEWRNVAFRYVEAKVIYPVFIPSVVFRSRSGSETGDSVSAAKYELSTPMIFGVIRQQKDYNQEDPTAAPVWQPDEYTLYIYRPKVEQ
jgi:hypothetical protein